MSQHNRLTMKDMLENNNNLSPYSLIDWIWPYQWVFNSTMFFSGLSGRYGAVMKMVMWLIFLTVIWPFTNLFYKFFTFYFASIVRLLTSKGGREGLKMNIFYVVSYTVWILFFLVPHGFQLVWFIPEYFTYTEFFEWLKLI